MDYAIDVLDNPDFAYRLWNMAHKKVESIHENPFLYPIYYQSDTIAGGGFRRAFVGNYLLFYDVDENTKVITIDSFIYSKRDLTQLFL